jgi:hypothetical protein
MKRESLSVCLTRCREKGMLTLKSKIQLTQWASILKKVECFVESEKRHRGLLLVCFPIAKLEFLC